MNKNIKKSVGLVLALALMLALALPAGAVSSGFAIAPDSAAELQTGRNVTIPFKITGFIPFAGLKVTIGYDSAQLSFIGFALNGEALPNAAAVCDTAAAGKAVVVIADSADVSLVENATVFSLQFEVLADASAQVSVSATVNDACDAALADVSFAAAAQSHAYTVAQAGAVGPLEPNLNAGGVTIDNTEHFIANISPSQITTIEALLARLNPNGLQLGAVQKPGGATIDSAQFGSTKPATGNTITFSDGANTQSFTFVVKGDVDGNGAINANDLLKQRRHVLRYTTLENEFFKAGFLVTADGKVAINAQDVLRLQQSILRFNPL